MQCSGVIFRSYREAFRRAGLLDTLVAGASATTQRVVESPPSALGWSAEAMTALWELCVALQRQNGREAVSVLAHHAASEGINTILKPIFSTLFSAFGTSPHSIFGNLAAINKLCTRGAEFLYDRGGEHHGVLRINNAAPVPDAWDAAWAGVQRFAFDLCKTKGTVRQVERLDDGRRTAFAVNWE